MGASNIETALVQYSGYKLDKDDKYIESIHILSESSEKYNGGNHFDYSLVDYFINEFNSLAVRKDKKSLREFPKSLVRLKKEVMRYKDILSANKVHPVVLNELQGDDNLKVNLERKVFEDMIADKLAQISKPVFDLFDKQTNVTLADVHGVELLGGGLRVPKVQELLQE